RATWIAAARAGVQRGLRIRWLAFSVPEDVALCHELHDQIAEEAPSHPQEFRTPTLRDPGLADTDVCVATRFHAAIFAIAYGIPPMGAPFDSKVARLHRMLEVTSFLAHAPSDRSAGAHDGDVRSQIEFALSGGFTPDYQQLQRRIELHEQALASLR